MPFLRESDDVFELFLGTEGVELDEANPENRFTLEWIEQVNRALDEVAQAGSSSKKGLVITATGIVVICLTARIIQPSPLCRVGSPDPTKEM